MLHLEKRHLNIVQEILSKFPFTFYAFGSRVKGTYKPFTDLDLCVKEELPELTKFYLEEAFEESNLPFKVDLIEWKRISKDFQSLIKNDLVPIR